MPPALEVNIIVLLSAAALVALAVRRIRLPYTAALVLVGLALGFSHGISAVHLTPEIVFFLFLPALLFEAGFHLNIRDFVSSKWTIGLLAVPGVLLTTLVVGGIVTLGVSLFGAAVGFSLGYALLFGALISATDPISVLAVLKRIGISRRLSIIMEGESLFNDGTAVVVFGIVLSFLTGETFTVWSALGRFVTVVAGGVGVGLSLGFIVSYLTAQVDDHLIEVTLTTILAYGTYLVAETIGVSGVIGVVVAGMMSGNLGAKRGMSPTTRLAVESFWEYVVFVINSLVFILIGIELSVANLIAYWWVILVAWAGVVAARFVVVYLTRPIAAALEYTISRRWGVVLAWGGIRGALCMVLVLSLPRDFPHRELILTMTYGVVFFTLIGQGLTMKPLLTLLGLSGRADKRDAYEEHRGALMATARVLDEIDRMVARRVISQDAGRRLSSEYRRREKEREGKIRELHLAKSTLRDTELLFARRHLLMVEKETVKQAYAEGHVTDEIMRTLLARIDADILELDAQEEQDAP